MASGIITLDGTKHIVVDPRSVQRSNANQVSARFGQGQSEYDDLIDWVNWVMDDWRAGVSQKDSEAGGSAFSTCETRFEGAITLGGFFFTVSQMILQTFSGGYVDYVAGSTNFVEVEIPEGEERGISRIMDVGDVLLGIDVVLRSQPDIQFKLNARWVTDGVPGSEITSAATQVLSTGEERDEPGYHWYRLHLTNPVENEGDAPRTVLVTIAPVNGALSMATMSSTAVVNWRYDGTSWSTGVVGPLCYFVNGLISGRITHIARRPDPAWVHLFSVGNTLYKVLNGKPEVVHVFGKNITDLFVLGTTLYVGQGDSDPYHKATMTSTGITGREEMFHPGKFFILHNGFLWRIVGGSAYYTGDDTELFWEQVEVALDANATITGMAGLEGDLIVSTEEGLYRITPGDWVHLITPWGKQSPKNGKNMISFQGHVYIPIENGIVRYDAAGILPMGFELGEGLPKRWFGEIAGWAASNNWLVCAIESVEANGISSLWTHNGQGWHCIAVFPRSWTGADSITAIESDFGRDSAGALSGDFDGFVVGTKNGLVYRSDVPNSKRPLLRRDTLRSASSWMETPWHFGRLVEVVKDWESVYMAIEPMFEGQRVEVYYQRHEDDDWTHLGNITEHGMEIRWDDDTRMEDDSHLRFGFVLFGRFTRRPPVVEAIRVKYEPMIPDRWQWSLPITVSPNQQLVDGSIALESTASRLRHLDALIRRVTPFKFIDVDGVEYDVKVVTHNRNVLKLEWIGHQTEVQYIYNLVLKQVTVESNGEDS